MIDLHYWPTPNGWQIAIMLEECGLPYRMVPVNIGRGEQFTPEFVALLHPHHTMPAIVDRKPPSGRVPLTVTQTGAILLYLAEKTGQFLPAGGMARLDVLQWLSWQITRMGPTAMQYNYFRQYATENVPSVIERYAVTLRTLYEELDRQLRHTGAYVAGAHYSIADMAVLPWIRLHRSHQMALTELPHLQRWLDTVRHRPGVRRGLALGQELRGPVLTEEARHAVFGPRKSLDARALPMR
jgi:GST-like protein